MRLILAAFIVFGSLLGCVALIGSLYPNGQWPWWWIPVLVVVFLVAFAASFVLFNCFISHTPPKSDDESLAELREKELLLSESFTARRAFQVEEFEDEGSHYYIELTDSRTLYLSGQYLYDFEPISDAPDLEQTRRFPCTEFTIFRHKQTGDVLDIVCAGTVLEPEAIAPHFSVPELKHGVPEDGDILLEPTYDEIKTQRLREHLA